MGWLDDVGERPGEDGRGEEWLVAMERGRRDWAAGDSSGAVEVSISLSMD